MRHRKSKKAGKGENRLKLTWVQIAGCCSVFVLTTCVAGHVTIEVDELSDSQEKDESNKKSGGPGQLEDKFSINDSFCEH